MGDVHTFAGLTCSDKPEFIYIYNDTHTQGTSVCKIILFEDVSCSRNTRKVFVEPAKVNIFLILDQIIPNACLAGVHPQNSAFMIDLFFSLRLCLAYSFTSLFSLLLKALGKKKKKTCFTYTVCAGHSCMFAALLEFKQIIARRYVSRHGWNLRFHISCTQKP